MTRPPPPDAVIDLYERHALAFDSDRGRALQERAWLDRFLACVPPGGTVLDLGCGMAEPIGAYVVGAGRRLVGVDTSPTLVGLARARYPDHEWLVGDMRALALGRCFDGILAWDSFFHLPSGDQRGMFARFAAHARSGAPLMFTSGTSAGEAIGEYQGEPLYHASLAPDDYGHLLQAHGFVVRAHVVEDPACGCHTVWLATRAATSHSGHDSR